MVDLEFVELDSDECYVYKTEIDGDIFTILCSDSDDEKAHCLYCISGNPYFDFGDDHRVHITIDGLCHDCFREVDGVTGNDLAGYVFRDIVYRNLMGGGEKNEETERSNN